MNQAFIQLMRSYVIGTDAQVRQFTNWLELNEIEHTKG
jgi:hypothetical protein